MLTPDGALRSYCSLPTGLYAAIVFAIQCGETMMAIRVIGLIVFAAATAIALVDPPATGASLAKVQARAANVSARSEEITSIAPIADVGGLAPNASLCRGLLDDPRTWTYANVAAVGE